MKKHKLLASAICACLTAATFTTNVTTVHALGACEFSTEAKMFDDCISQGKTDLKYTGIDTLIFTRDLSGSGSFTIDMNGKDIQSVVDTNLSNVIITNAGYVHFDTAGKTYTFNEIHSSGVWGFSRSSNYTGLFYLYNQVGIDYSLYLFGNATITKDINISSIYVNSGTAPDSLSAGVCNVPSGRTITVMNSIYKGTLNLECGATFVNDSDNVITAADNSVQINGVAVDVAEHTSVSGEACPVEPVIVPEAESSVETFVVTFLDCDGNTVSVQSVPYQGNAVPPSGYTYEGYTNVSAHIDLKPTSCNVAVNKVSGYVVPNTADKG
ncbi:MAG: hypothetical protein LKF50_04695 [Solobacterium sp.]|jgi:hypothetical protein|nr:hypothetical protein [Solobacterium sp.]